jgi:Serine/threonine protein kinase
MNLPEGHNLQNAKYKLTKVIGQGGFGITYLGVWNTEVKGKLGTVKTEVPICLKEFFFKDYCYRDTNTSHVLVHSETGRLLFDKFKEKLIKEAKILSDVHHPYIVNVLEVFEENNTAYIAMEHISGCSLKFMLDTKGVLPEKKVLRYISQIGQALDFVHKKNIVHLDIKPSNILIDKKNNARLIDFGVSKRYDIEQQETSTTMLSLSKGFAPIEQYDDEGTQSFSPCPDIYSLGATMYNLLTGEIPPESILRVSKPLNKPSGINREVTQQTEDVILRAMQVNPIHRYPSVKDMINELNIPSYFEETSNLLIEGPNYQSNNDNEDTELLSDSSTSQSVDDEQTLVRQPEDPNISIRKKKNKRRVLIPLMIFIIAMLGGGVAYILNINESQGASRTENLSTIITRNSENAADENTYLTDGTIPEEYSQGGMVTNMQQTESTRPEANNASTNLITESNSNENILSLEERESLYNELLSLGKISMNQKKYSEARAAFDKANELKSTTEVRRLLMDLDTTEEEDMIVGRKALYEEIQSFGDLIIVKRISTGRWGAIDNKGEERILCQYLRAAPSGINKAFEREDHRYDIYDIKGDRVGSGLNEY